MPPKKKGKDKKGGGKPKAPPKTHLELVRITAGELKAADDPFAPITEQLKRQVGSLLSICISLPGVGVAIKCCMIL
jgi:hypothetical protein